MQSVTLFLVLALLVCSCSAFFVPSRQNVRQSQIEMVFGFGKKEAPTTTYKVNQGTANKGAYIPDGLTPAQYEAKLKAEAEAKASKSKKFPRGKVTESLTEWIEKCESKGLTGKDMNLKGHRLAKCKYDSMYTNESPI